MRTLNKINQFKLLLLASLIFFAGCNNDHSKEAKAKNNLPTGEGIKIQTVEVVKPQFKSFKGEVLITGTAMPNRMVKVYAVESGYVKNWFKDIGDPVTKGSRIVELVNPVLDNLISEAQADLQVANTEVDAAEAFYQGEKELYERLNSIYNKTPALTPLHEVERAKANALKAEAEVNRAKAIHTKALSKVAIAKKRNEMLLVRAPFSGIISKRLVEVGALVQSGLTEANPMQIVEIQQTNPIRLTIPVPEKDILSIRKGMNVDITFPEIPGKTFSAKISRMAGALDPASRTMNVEVDIANKDGIILTGMYAKVLIQISSRENVLSLPNMTKTMYQDEPHVLIVKDGKVELISLRIGIMGKDNFEVLNPEITADSQVIIQGKNLVKPGQIVKPIIKQE